MAGHNPSSMSEDERMSVTAPIAVDPEEAAARSDMLQAQLKTSARLNEYYKQVVAELRASLERIEAEDQAS
jgi:hypothetical protein